MTIEIPRVTIGIPVYNGGASIHDSVLSVLNQTYTNVEVLVVDNASTDDTQAICTSLAESDSRVRYVRNETNIGQNANFSRVYQLATSEFFRWMGDDDWLEPEYVDECVAAFDKNPDASTVTTYQAHVKSDDTILYSEYTGPRPSSRDPMTRLAVLLRLLTEDPLWIDPVYSMMRRSHITPDEPIRRMRFGDQVLACELVLSGPYEHVPRHLANRRWVPLPQGRHANAQYSGGSSTGFKSWVSSSSQRLLMLKVLNADIWGETRFGLGQKVHGSWHLGTYGIRTGVVRVRGYATRRLPLLGGRKGTASHS